MAQVKAEYEEVNEFSSMAKNVVEKYPEVFGMVEVDKICCVAIINKERKNDKLWKLDAVTMPIRMHSSYAWYIIIYLSDWVEMGEKQKLLLVSDMLCGVGEEEGKVNPCDSKGYKLMFRTFKGIDYMTDPDVPHILNDRVEWKKDF